MRVESDGERGGLACCCDGKVVAVWRLVRSGYKGWVGGRWEGGPHACWCRAFGSSGMDGDVAGGRGGPRGGPGVVCWGRDVDALTRGAAAAANGGRRCGAVVRVVPTGRAWRGTAGPGPKTGGGLACRAGGMRSGPRSGAGPRVAPPGAISTACVGRGARCFPSFLVFAGAEPVGGVRQGAFWRERASHNAEWQSRRCSAASAAWCRGIVLTVAAALARGESPFDTTRNAAARLADGARGRPVRLDWRRAGSRPAVRERHSVDPVKAVRRCKACMFCRYFSGFLAPRFFTAHVCICVAQNTNNAQSLCHGDALRYSFRTNRASFQREVAARFPRRTFHRFFHRSAPPAANRPPRWTENGPVPTS